MNTTRAVVLARGVGSRMRAPDPMAGLSDLQARAADAGQKAMMPVGGRPFLDYVIHALADAELYEIALVVAPDNHEIRRHYESEARPARVIVHFVYQREARGTADALLAAEEWAGDAPFIAMNGDNLYPTDGLRSLAALDEPGLLAFERRELVRSSNIPGERVKAFALLEIDDRGYLSRIVEKPPPDLVAAAGSNALISMNCWRFDQRIFDACRDVPRSRRGEFELPEAVGLAIRRGISFKTVPARGPVIDLSGRSDVAEVARRLAAIVPRP